MDRYYYLKHCSLHTINRERENNMLKLNETPVRTSRNFHINNIKLDDVNIPNKITSFKNVSISKDSKRDFLELSTDDF